MKSTVNCFNSEVVISFRFEPNQLEPDAYIIDGFINELNEIYKIDILLKG